MAWYLWFESYFPFVIIGAAVIAMAVLAYLEVNAAD